MLINSVFHRLYLFLNDLSYSFTSSLTSNLNDMKTIFTYVAVLLVSTSVFAEISSTEKNALLKLYKATKGSQWTNKWDLKSPTTTWYGVEIKNDKVIGIITDGDIRRMLNKSDTIAGFTAIDIMTKNPKTIKSTDMVSDALNIMEDFSITQLVVVDEGVYKGVIHLHDILKEGIV